ncbi:RICIN domain-containing protein [Deinococcus malanensis]|nr:RICIN domain-containing protein [Deinococcus malanensis]
MSGDLGSHDPGLFKAGSTYCSMSTGIEDSANPGGVLVHRSSGGIGGNWSTLGAVPTPAWAIREYGVKNIWAPEVVYNGNDGRYYMYYAASQFGTRNSAIGVASSTSPCSTGTWTDHGAILRSSSTTTDYNAIDANVHWDSSSGWWMSWGSFSSGIKIQHMSSMTTFDGPIYTLATRPGVANNPVEAPSIFKRGNYYYLFVSWDYCCKGLDSTYKTVMGRATSITGPYYDKNGNRLDQGGGTIMLNDRANKVGQGGGDVYQESGNYYFTHHFYDRNSSGSPKMDVKLLEWNGNWPYTSEATNGYNLVNGGVYRLVNQTSGMCVDVQNGVASSTAQIQQWGCNGLTAQNFRLEQTADGFYRLRSMLGAQDMCLDIADGSSTPGADIRLWSCNSAFAQNWHLEDMGRGYHRLIGQQTRLALDNVNGSTSSGTEIRTWSMNGYAPQNWRLERR